MLPIDSYQDMIRLRDYSSAFSRNAFVDILNFDDYSKFDWLISQYDFCKCITYSDLLKKIYDRIRREYRCEYVYKNELIRLLLKKYGTRNTVFFSEFRVGNSIADITMFNGESKAFEIKTEYDSPKRLGKQMEDYKRLFDKCYLVIPEGKVDDYMSCVESATGVIVMKRDENRIILEEVKEAEQNPVFDTDIMISCLRTAEYIDIAKLLGVETKEIPGYEMYGHCKRVFVNYGRETLNPLFLNEIKRRKNNTSKLSHYPMPLRQMMLSLNLPEAKAQLLIEKLKTNINSQQPCIIPIYEQNSTN